MSFARLHKGVTYMMAGLGLAALFLGGELSVPSKIAFVAAFAASFFAEGRWLHSPAWQHGWTIALLVLSFVQVVRGVLGESPLALGLEFTAALQISRLCNRRTAVEHQQIAIVAFLHLCAATVLSTDLAYGVAFLGFVVVAPWMLALTHLRREIEAHYQGDADPARAGDVQRVLASRRIVGGAFLAATAALSLPLFAMTAAVFVAFPRVGLGLLAFGRGSPTHVAGFGGDVELGQVGLIRTDSTVLVRVTPPGLPPRPPLRAAIRLRGTSFDRYDGRRWTRTMAVPALVGRYENVYPVRRLPDARDRAWTIVLDHLDDTVVFLPEGAVAVEIPPRLHSGIEVGRRILLAPGMDLRYEDDDALGLRYRAWVSSDPRDRMRPRITPEERAAYLQFPEGHERVAALARAWTEGASSDHDRARRIVARLHAFEYSLEMRDPGARAPLEAFLFEWRAGHCEYFSTAMVVMLRALGIPARNVTGFLGGRWNAYGGYYAITSAEAHSWVEAWIDGQGWVSFEPTPAGRAEEALGAGLLDALAEMIDALRTRWEDDVVSFDLRAQRGLALRLARLLRSLASPGDRSTESSEIARDRSVSRSSWSPAAWLLAPGVALAIAVGLALRARRGRGPGSPHRSLADGAREAVRLYRALERALEARGRPRPPSRTPREHAEALAREGFAGSEAVAAITERYLEARFGGREIDAAELARLRGLLRTLGRHEN